MDNKYMLRCLELARKGKGKVAPNPMVGAVIVHNNKIIGEGWHKKYGEAHAEINAIRSVEDISLFSQSTMYVSLEPCSHFGKTPPCVNSLIEHSFKKVVVGCIDPFSKVAGNGIKRLKQNGIEVKVGVLEEECRHINRRFFTFHEKKRPYVILKWAQSKDGFLDIERTGNERGIHWITQPKTQHIVHKWRSEETAILVGKNTVLNDNPLLTVRLINGENPIRIILDSFKEIPENFNVFSNDAPTWIFNRIENKTNQHIQWIKVKELTPQIILNELYKKDIQSLFVEGGGAVLQSFINMNLWDEARILTGTSLFNKGLVAPKLSKPITHSFSYGEDQIDIILKKEAHVPFQSF